MKENKIKYGQFYTKVNPFDNEFFLEWMKLIENDGYTKIIEPFAGANNLVKMFYETIEGVEGIHKQYTWGSFDIEPPNDNNYPGVKVNKRDTIEDFPQGYEIGITNPPYLAKNSATRKGITYPKGFKHDDLYKISLEVMLTNLKYVAAIIPDSYINSDIFRDRLYLVGPLKDKMFDDTQNPVMLALFIPKDVKERLILEDNIISNSKDFLVWIKGKETVSYKNLENMYFQNKVCNIVGKKNNKKGKFGAHLIDNTKDGTGIKFCKGEEIDESVITPSSRSKTRFDIDIKITESYTQEDIINKLNEYLREYRENTHDILLTSFKGLRKDGEYRKRLDFGIMSNIINHCFSEHLKKGEC